MANHEDGFFASRDIFPGSGMVRPPRGKSPRRRPVRPSLISRGPRWDARDLERRVSEQVKKASLSDGFGLGEEVDEGKPSPLDSFSQKPEFKQMREKVTPWLWVFSMFGFGMAMLNTYRIKKIFRSWKGARQYARDAD